MHYIFHSFITNFPLALQFLPLHYNFHPCITIFTLALQFSPLHDNCHPCIKIFTLALQFYPYITIFPLAKNIFLLLQCQYFFNSCAFISLKYEHSIQWSLLSGTLYKYINIISFIQRNIYIYIPFISEHIGILECWQQRIGLRPLAKKFCWKIKKLTT